MSLDCPDLECHPKLSPLGRWLNTSEDLGCPFQNSYIAIYLYESIFSHLFLPSCSRVQCRYCSWCTWRMSDDELAPLRWCPMSVALRGEAKTSSFSFLFLFADLDKSLNCSSLPIIHRNLSAISSSHFVAGFNVVIISGVRGGCRTIELAPSRWCPASVALAVKLRRAPFICAPSSYVMLYRCWVASSVWCNSVLVMIGLVSCWRMVGCWGDGLG